SSRSEGEARLIDDHVNTTSQNVTIEEKITDLFEALRVSIFSYLTAVFGRSSANEIEDITQEAFLQLLRAMQKGNQIENHRAWLFRVAHNLAINRIKSRQFIAPLSEEDWDAICRRLPDTGMTPEQRTQRLEDFARVYQALSRLTFAERQC